MVVSITKAKSCSRFYFLSHNCLPEYRIAHAELASAPATSTNVCDLGQLLQNGWQLTLSLHSEKISEKIPRKFPDGRSWVRVCVKSTVVPHISTICRSWTKVYTLLPATVAGKRGVRDMRPKIASISPHDENKPYSNDAYL